MVCQACNQYFSKSLDMVLARGSPEGLERYRWGVRSVKEYGKFNRSAVPLSAKVEGDFSDALAELDPDEESLSLRGKLRPQVGFATKASEKFKYFSFDAFQRGDWKSDPDVDPKKGVRLIECDFDEVKQELAASGVRFSKWRPMLPPDDPARDVIVESQFEFPVDFLRAIAKIAFNYLAFSNGRDTALRKEFDSTRRFIRLGREPFLPSVMLHAGEIYRPRNISTSADYRPILHIVAVTEPLNAEVVIGQVTLFNAISYDVTLAYSRVSDLRRSGHLFNLRTRKAHIMGQRDPSKTS